MFKRGARKKAAATPTSSEPVRESSAPADADMFGGMTIVKKVDGRSSTSARSESDDEGADPKLSQYRKRMIAIYEKYAPEKISNVDAALQRYRGREEEIIAVMVEKYGPEPSPAGGTNTSAVGFETAENDGNGFGFGANDGASGAGAFGFATTGDPTDTSGGGAFGFATDDNDNTSSTGGGAFGFATDDAGANGGGGFGFGGADETSSATGGSAFGFATDGPTGFPKDEDSQSAANRPPTPMTETESVRVAKKPEDEKQFPGMVSRHDAELKKQQNELEAATKQLGECADMQVKAGTEREGLVSRFYEATSAQERAVADEDYSKAEELSLELETLGKKIDDCDNLMAKQVAAAAALRKKHASLVRSISDLLRRQRSEMDVLRNDQQQKLKAYVTSKTHRIDTDSDRVVEDMGKATRNVKNVSEELENSTKREKKITDKIDDQTSELRDIHTDATEEMKQLEDEIKQLEQTLATKRRQLAEKKNTVDDMEHKMKLVKEEHEEAIQRVSAQKREDTKRLAAAEKHVRELEEQQSQLEVDRSNMKQTQEKWETEINNIDVKLETITGQISSVEDSLLNAVEEEATNIASMIRCRMDGTSMFLDCPHRQTDETGVLTLKHKIRSASDRENEYRTQADVLTSMLPQLEIQKKTFAAKKQFKDALAKTEEIKRITGERDKLLSEAEGVGAEIKSLESELALVLSETKEEEDRKVKAKTVFATSLAQLLASTEESRNNCVEAAKSVENASWVEDYVAAEERILDYFRSELARVTSDIGAAADVTGLGDLTSLSEAQERLQTLEEQLAEYEEQEDYLRCEEIQQEIDKLQRRIEAVSALGDASSE